MKKPIRYVYHVGTYLYPADFDKQIMSGLRRRQIEFEFADIYISQTSNARLYRIAQKEWKKFQKMSSSYELKEAWIDTHQGWTYLGEVDRSQFQSWWKVSFDSLMWNK